MKKQTILSLMMILFFITSKAQNNTSLNISGNVTDAQSNDLLIGATITILDAATNKTTTCVTNEKGSFKLTVKQGKYNISVDYVGYETYLDQNFVVGTDEQYIKNIKLSSKSNQLSGVTIKASSAKPFIQQTANKIIVDVSQSPIATGGNAYDVILRAPGVIEQNNSLNFRLKTVHVLINGKPTNLSGEELKAMLQNLPANSVDKIEILPNPSAKYDAQGGSVIDIKLAENKNYGTSGSITGGSGIGKNAQYFTGLSLNYKQEKLSLYGNYNYQHNKLYYSSITDREVSSVSNLHQDNYDLRTKNNQTFRLGADYNFNAKNTIGFQFRGSYINQNRLGNNKTLLTNSVTGNDSASTVQATGKTRVNNPAVNIYYKSELDSLGREITFNADYFSYDKQWQDNFTTNYYDQNNKQYLSPYFLRSNSPGKNTLKSLALDYSHPSSIGNFGAGLKTSFTETDNNSIWDSMIQDQWLADAGKTNHFIYDENIYAGYFTYEKAIANSWQINAGLRVEETNSKGTLINTGQITNRNYTDLFPTIGLQYFSGLNHVFNLNYRKSIDRFGFDIVNPFIRYQNQYSYYQGNPSISPQINQNLEFNYIYKQCLVLGASYTKSTNALAPVFRKGADNVVISSYDNLKSSDYFYIYASYSKSLTPTWNLNLIGGTGFYKFDTSTLQNIAENANVK